MKRSTDRQNVSYEWRHQHEYDVINMRVNDVINMGMTSLTWVWRHQHEYDVINMSMTSLTWVWRHQHESEWRHQHEYDAINMSMTSSTWEWMTSSRWVWRHQHGYALIHQLDMTDSTLPFLPFHFFMWHIAHQSLSRALYDSQFWFLC